MSNDCERYAAYVIYGVIFCKTFLAENILQLDEQSDDIYNRTHKADQTDQSTDDGIFFDNFNNCCWISSVDILPC